MESTDTGTSHEGRHNPVLCKSTILYIENNMQDNVGSLDRITAVTCVCKLLYTVLTNTLSFHCSHASVQNGCSLTLYGSSGFTTVSPPILISILHWLGCATDLDIRWLVLDLKVQLSAPTLTMIKSMPGFQRLAYCNRASVRFAMCASTDKAKDGNI